MEPRSHEIKFSNGIYNLKANQYIPAEDLSPIDNLSIQTVGYEYDATASCERIQQFIYEIASGEEEKAEILFDIAALALIDESPQFLFFLLGNGANGKSLYLKLLAMLAGGSKGYQFQLEKDVLSDGKYINKMPYLDKLQYKRLITTSELNKNQIIDATLIKSLTGGDIVTARANYAEPSNFQFYGSIVIAGNSFPEFDDKSYGLERRVVLIPFLENFLNIPIENQKSTKDFEKIFRAELPGFFNFLLERIIKFYKNISDFSVLDDFKYSENNTISKQFIISKVDDIKAGKTELKSAVEDLIDANFFSNANSKIALKEFLSTINNDLESVIDRKACLDILDELGYEVRRSSGNQEFVFGLQMKQMSMFEDENSCDKLVISDDTILSIAKNKSRTRINKFKKIGRNI
jgi:P4 family phage/plasmid primase-like protien